MNIVIIGATSEMAKEVGRIYSQQKNSFLLIGRDSIKLQNIKQDFLARGATEVTINVVNLDDPSAYQSLYEFSCETFKQIDLLILAHGALPTQVEIENDIKSVEACARTNFLSYISILTIFANKFENQKSGSIAVFTSVAGDRGRRSNYIYGSFKAGVQTFLEGYSARLSRSDVHVLDIRPGMIDTPMTAHLEKNFLYSSSSYAAENIVSAISAKKAILYTPFFWRFIMLVIKGIPNKIFNKLNF
jgi:decaprenylphospho-beta-D-erythro-pentofuranosid-2-ulose 2-reductase